MAEQTFLPPLHGAGFAGQIQAIAGRTQARLRGMIRSAAIDLMTRAQAPQQSAKFTGGTFEVGKIPVLTGFMRDSLVSRVDQGVGYSGAESYRQAAAEFEPGQRMVMIWAAEYSIYVERGTRRIRPRRWVDYNAESWQAIARAAAERAAAAR